MTGRMRDFPRSVRIRDREGKWHTWTIHWRRKLSHPRTKFAHGLCHRDGSRMIELRMGLSRDQRLETFWHEVMHAVAIERGFRLCHPTIYNLAYSIGQLLHGSAVIRWAA